MTATSLGPCASPIALAGVFMMVLPDMVMPSALKTRTPAALVPSMVLPATVPLTGFCEGWNARPIAPWNSWNSFSPPVSSGSVLPSASLRPMFLNELPATRMFSIPPVPSCCMAAWHVSLNALSSIVTFERVRSWYVRSSTSEPAKPGMQAVSLNDRPRMATLSASTSIREWPVKTTGPGLPPTDSIVSGSVMSRTVLLCVPGRSAIVAPGRALSAMPCSADRGAASMTYAFGVHCGRAYTAPVLACSPRPSIWLLADARPTLLWVSASITATRGLAKSYSEA